MYFQNWSTKVFEIFFRFGICIFVIALFIPSKSLQFLLSASSFLCMGVPNSELTVNAIEATKINEWLKSVSPRFFGWCQSCLLESLLMIGRSWSSLMFVIFLIRSMARSCTSNHQWRWVIINGVQHRGLIKGTKHCSSIWYVTVVHVASSHVHFCKHLMNLLLDILVVFACINWNCTLIFMFLMCCVGLLICYGLLVGLLELTKNSAMWRP